MFSLGLGLEWFVRRRLIETHTKYLGNKGELKTKRDLSLSLFYKILLRAHSSAHTCALAYMDRLLTSQPYVVNMNVIWV